MGNASVLHFFYKGAHTSVKAAAYYDEFRTLAQVVCKLIRCIFYKALARCFCPAAKAACARVNFRVIFINLVFAGNRKRRVLKVGQY